MSAGFGVAGCGQSRSNLLPGDTVTEMNRKLDKVTTLFEQGNCFRAFDVDRKLQAQVFALRNTSVDEKLRNNLQDGINQLNVNLHSTCVQTDTAPVPQADTSIPSTVTPEGDSGTSDESGTTGTTGNTSDKKSQNDKGKDKPTTPDKSNPKPTPGPEPKPPNPTPEPEPGPVPPDSGGISPG